MSKELSEQPLPSGQRAGAAFPRFGAAMAPLPDLPEETQLRITGALGKSGEITLDDLATLPRHEQVSDLHCVTTWTKRGLRWSGWRLADLYERLVVPRFQPRSEACWLVLFGLDGYCCSLLIEDALADRVLVADTLDGEPLSPVHGAPLRVVCPDQYGYKSLKHFCGISLREKPVRLPLGLEHPRGRVALEERHAQLPAGLVRLPYRTLIALTAYLHRRGVQSQHFVGRSTLLDELMPNADHYEVHDIWLQATPEVAYRALSDVVPREIRILGPLMALRQLPAFLTGQAKFVSASTPTDPATEPKNATIFATIEQAGFARVAEEAGREVVFGVAGRFWKLTRNKPVASVRDRESFLAFDEPGHAKAAMSFLIRAEGTGCRLITETRIVTTDAKAGRSFRRYWRFVRPGSGLIRRSWLAAVRRRLAAGHGR